METVLTTIDVTRAQGLGGAGAALGKDADMTWINPSAAAGAESPSMTLSGYREFFDELTGQIQGALPSKYGVFFAGVTYSDAGEAEILTLDGNSRVISLQQDLLFCGGYAKRIGNAAAVGGALKVMHSTILEEYSADLIVGDLGVQYDVMPNVACGMALQNFGGKYRYLEERLDAPTWLRAGAGGKFLLNNGDAVQLVGDVQYALFEEEFTISGGMEYLWGKTIALRAGIRESEREDLSNFSMGLGFIMWSLELNYGIRISREYDAPQSISLTLAKK